MMKNLKKIIFLNIFLISFSTVSYTQDWFDIGIKTSIGLSGITRQVSEEYNNSISTNKLKPNTSFSLGIVNSFHFNGKRKLCLNVEYLYNYSAFEELTIYQGFNSLLQRISHEHIESRKVEMRNFLFPVKLNFEYKQFILAGGIVNTINLVAKSNSVWTIEELDSGVKGIVWEENLKTKTAKKSTNLGSIYLDKIYNLQYIIELGFSISHKHKIGIEYMNYITQNNINHVFWSEDVVQHNKYSMNNNMISVNYVLSI